jgi:hypothetical protein
MKAYRSSEEAKREAGLVSERPVEVGKRGGVEVEVRVGVEVAAACSMS